MSITEGNKRWKSGTRHGWIHLVLQQSGIMWTAENGASRRL